MPKRRTTTAATKKAAATKAAATRTAVIKATKATASRKKRSRDDDEFEMDEDVYCSTDEDSAATKTAAPRSIVNIKSRDYDEFSYSSIEDYPNEEDNNNMNDDEVQFLGSMCCKS